MYYRSTLLEVSDYRTFVGTNHFCLFSFIYQYIRSSNINPSSHDPIPWLIILNFEIILLLLVSTCIQFINIYFNYIMKFSWFLRFEKWCEFWHHSFWIEIEINNGSDIWAINLCFSWPIDNSIPHHQSCEFHEWTFSTFEFYTIVKGYSK